MAHKTARVVKRKGKPPLIKSPVGPSKRKPKQQTPKLPKPPAGMKWEKVPKFRDTFGGKVRVLWEAKKGGTVRKPTVHKRYGGMSHVGLSPAEEARSGTMPQVKRRRYMKKGGTVYRKLGGKVTNGNDVVRMIYRGSS